jgi:DNA-binding transcriptional LysR family regulator
MEDVKKRDVLAKMHRQASSGPVHGPEWSQLQTFLILARTQRLAAAGRRLHIDHSTVSRHIAALEEAFAVRLFDRRENGFFLTPEGERLFQAAEQMESLMMDVHKDIVGKDLQLTGTVRIGVPDGLGVGFLASRLAHFASSQPGLTIELVAISRIFNLTKREADIAITLARPEHGRLVAQKILDYSLQLYATKGYLNTHPPVCNRSDLLEHGLIAFIEDLNPISELNFLDEIQAGLRPCFASSTIVCQLEAILAGAGIGILPRFMAASHPSLVCVLPDAVRLKRTFWLNVHADLRRLTRIRVTCDFLVQEMRREAELFK